MGRENLERIGEIGVSGRKQDIPQVWKQSRRLVERGSMDGFSKGDGVVFECVEKPEN